MLYLYDATWEGLLTAVFQAFLRKDAEACIQAESRFPGVSLFPTCRVETDGAKAARVAAGMARLSGALPAIAYKAFLSETEGMENALLGTLRIGFANRRDPLPRRQEEPVRLLNTLAERVGGEAHRFLQFIRFVRAGPDLYAADIEPDYFVLPLIGGHFHVRFNDQRLVVRDVKRRLALLSTPEEWWIAPLPAECPPLPRDDAAAGLWKAYFRDIANPARLNHKLQRQFVPLKYRRHIVEFQ
ncbi:MAG: TIGR03915 family putative DNA repair protein [Oscillospiraceae bacterium]|jgi:probable DNA metabolism protein|nr:TIGR03915 family putative DNA repair protein [Oscillospiraceae bacterium]